MLKNSLFTSESVTEGHPDKVCDQVSDAILDNIIAKDPNARVACETTCTTGVISVMGEISTETYADIPSIVRKTVRDIGYDNQSCGFDGSTCAVVTSIDEQSPDIALGVNNSLEYKSASEDDGNKLGAGDQGMMFGYACDETADYMPTAIYYAHAITRRLAAERKNGNMPFLRPDGKSQVTIYYDNDGKPVAAPTIVVSTQHAADADMRELRERLVEEVVRPVMPEQYLTKDTKFYINPTGRFVVGGPQGDSGLTGRKLIVDTYGGYGRHGGGSFSGKDPTKVDRSASYMARYVAKNIVAAGLCSRCELELAYAIGIAKPVSVCVETFGTAKISEEKIVQMVLANVDFRPSKIIEKLDLRRPIFLQTASYGHFGRPDLDLSWEKLDLVDAFRQ